jgi:L-fuconolactonase
MRVDAHQHFWNIADRQGGWPPPQLRAIHRDFGPADLQPWLAQCGMGGTVLVQSMPTVQDTRWMLDLADRHAFVLGIVGWVDLLASDVGEQLAALAARAKFKGLRPMLQDLADPRWIANPQLDPAASALCSLGLCFDALVRPVHLRSLLVFARRHPELRIVIDHGAKPDIAAGALQPWATDIAALAELPNLHCKLSGLLTEAQEGASGAVLAPYVDHLFACFGPERLMWGSDWPVLELASDYGTWMQCALELCEPHVGRDAAAIDAIFGANAIRFYGLTVEQASLGAS